MENTFMINLTEKAAQQIATLIQSDEKPEEIFGLRIFVEGGGCSGFQYNFKFETEASDDDYIIELNDVKVLIDPLSMQYLQGSEIDFQTKLAGSNFTIKNPNVKNTCGCGSSFYT